MNKQTFWERQGDLLWLANTDAGRHLLGIKDDRKIIKISPNSNHFFNGFVDRKIISVTAKSTTNDYNAFRLLPILETLDIYRELQKEKSRLIENPYEALLHFSGLERNNKYPQIYLNQTVFYSNAGGTGDVRDVEVIATGWPTVIGRASGTAANPSSSGYIASNRDGTNYTCARGSASWDTSALTSGAVITAGSNTAEIYITAHNDGSSHTDFRMVANTQASDTTLATSDYNKLTGGARATAAITFANATNNAYNLFTLTATAEGEISKTGFTKFAFNSNLDLASSAPDPLETSDVTFTGGGAAPNAPRLTINYTLPEEGGAALFGIL